LLFVNYALYNQHNLREHSKVTTTIKQRLYVRNARLFNQD
jgi:hypothetical protein